MKYKAGDCVRVRKDLEVNESYNGVCFAKGMEKYLGTVVTISKINNLNHAYLIKEDSGLQWWTDDMFEGLATFTKADLKDGDIVTDREGCKSVYCESLNTLYGNTVKYIWLNDDLTDKVGEKANDIVKVERPVKYETVFERKEEPTEMTVEEIEKKLGMPKGTLRVKGADE